MKTTYNILIFLIFVTFYQCSSESGIFDETVLTPNQKLQSVIDKNKNLVFDDDTLLTKSILIEYYKNTDYQPIWCNDSTLNQKGNDLIQLIDEAYNFGLFPEFYHSKTIHQLKDTALYKTELILSNAYLLYITHLKVGFIDTINLAYVWKKDSVDYNWYDKLNAVKSTEHLKNYILDHQPEYIEYKNLQKGLETFVSSYPLDTIHSKITNFKEDSVQCYKDTKTALFLHHFIKDTVISNEALLNAIKQFQVLHGLKDDGIVGKWTAKMLELSNMDRFLKGVVSLEKWRWKKQEDIPDRYISVNVPAFTLKLWDQQKVIAEHRVVVGTFDTQTPEFHAKLRRMVTNPYWHLPYSIASTEFLAQAKKDTSYFREKGFKLFRDGKEVDPLTVDWSTIKETNFRYRVRQDGGFGNSLGRLKFLFPNPHSVFIHDTPSKSLFMNDIRSYSHGCVRLHQPFDLGRKILEIDENRVIPDSLQPIIDRGEQKVIELNQPFEVYIEYFTASADSSGHLILHPDIYNRDEKYIKIITQKVASNLP